MASAGSLCAVGGTVLLVVPMGATEGSKVLEGLYSPTALLPAQRTAWRLPRLHARSAGREGRVFTTTLQAWGFLHCVLESLRAFLYL